MKYTCGSYLIENEQVHEDYSVLSDYVGAADTLGAIVGEDARDYYGFRSFDATQPLAKVENQRRIGVVLDSYTPTLELCALHDLERLALGFNSCVVVIDLTDCSVPFKTELDCVFHHFLCNDKVIVAVHELGVEVYQITDFNLSTRVDCDVVSSVQLKNNMLTIEAMDGEVRELNLAAKL